MSPMAIGRLFKIAVELGVCRFDRGFIQSDPERGFAVSIYACYSYALNLPSMIELPQPRFPKWSSVWHQDHRKMPAEQADITSGDRSHGKVLGHALQAAKQCHREPDGLVFPALVPDSSSRFRLSSGRSTSRTSRCCLQAADLLWKTERGNPRLFLQPKPLGNLQKLHCVIHLPTSVSEEQACAP